MVACHAARLELVRVIVLIRVCRHVDNERHVLPDILPTVIHQIRDLHQCRVSAPSQNSLTAPSVDDPGRVSINTKLTIPLTQAKLSIWRLW